MIDLHELRQFTAFADCGTLSEASKILHLSQPALSRSMKNLEADLGIPLFVRRKNKLELNENGKYVLTLARELLTDADSLVLKARIFDRRSRTISLGVCAPAPSWLIAPLLSSLYPDRLLQTEITDDDKLLSGIADGSYQLIVLPYRPDGGQYFVKECGRETLMFALPKEHRFARRKSLSFSEMNGENMLLMNDIGFWNFVQTEKMPDSRFLTQTDRFSFVELLKTSVLAAFTTDLAGKYLDTDKDLSGIERVNISISDPEASVTYYLTCRKEERKEFSALFSMY